MKALSLLQPWCSVVVAGLKPIENRKTRPPVALFGEVFAIHSSLGWDQDAVPLIEALTRQVWPADQQPRGMILGVARLAGYVKGDRMFPGFCEFGGNLSPERVAAAMDDPWFLGPVGYVLEDVRALPQPIRWKGMIGWWPVPPDVERQITEQLA